jgi:hypothetical protein
LNQLNQKSEIRFNKFTLSANLRIILDVCNAILLIT